ncbi:MAG: HutD family protein [Cypionkella sp.]
MIRHLTPADYREMAWANGKGVTVEMLRVEDNGLKYRLSRASVVEDGDFSIFPDIERNLTVISGPGFDLQGDAVTLSARPLCPVAFAGDTPIRAAGVTTASDDFNVMTARALPLPDVSVQRTTTTLPANGTLAIFALAAGSVNETQVGRYDLIVTDQAVRVDGQFIVVRWYDSALASNLEQRLQ